MMKICNRAAFSLVELSIVLVILGLLTGGILAGQSLIHAAELRAVSTEFNRYMTAVQSFRDRYFAIPGDFNKATQFWGAVGTCPGTVGTGTQTCDGDGNGRIASWKNLNNSGTNGGYEVFRAWQHLANAGLIEGSYNGLANQYGTASNQAQVGGVNVPKSKLGQALWTMVYWGTNPDSANGNTYVMPGDYGHVMIIGNVNSYHSMGMAGVMSTTDAWNIDTKMDDGMPGIGRVNAENTACVSSYTPATATYQLTTTGDNICGLVFKMGM